MIKIKTKSIILIYDGDAKRIKKINLNFLSYRKLFLNNRFNNRNRNRLRLITITKNPGGPGLKPTNRKKKCVPEETNCTGEYVSLIACETKMYVDANPSK